MATLTELRIKGYRSIRDEIVLRFPERTPVVLVGENNAGKTNVLRALDLLLGEQWPGSREPEDHDFWGRKRDTAPIEIQASFNGMGDQGNVRSLIWRYAPQEERKPCFEAVMNTGHRNRYVREEWREQCTCIWITADRRLSYHLSYASKWTFLSKLMNKFHSALVQNASRVEALKRKFDEIEEIFKDVDEFASFESELSAMFEEMFSGMTYGLRVDFSAYDPSRYFHSLRVVPSEGDDRRALDELGTGQEQLLAFAFAHAYAKAFYGGIILAIDEPEAHLHPLAQEWLAQKIHEMSQDGLQIVLTTHSPHFINILDIEGLILVRKDRCGSTQICQLDKGKLAEYCRSKGAGKATPDNILNFYADHVTQEILNGFFAKKIVLVEGATERLAIPVYLRKVGFDVTREGVAIIPVMGKGNIAKWWRLFTAYGIPTYITFDGDMGEDGDGRKRRDVLNTIGIPVQQHNEILEYSDWIVQDRFCVFGKDFETEMRRQFPSYRKLEEEAQRQYGDSKPIIARYVANKLEDSEASGWEMYRRLGEAIGNLT